MMLGDHFTKDKTELIRRIDVALKRMESRGHQNTVHYERLKAKRNAIATGKEYLIINVTLFLIAYVGAHIPECNIGINGKRIPPRGDKIRATVEAVENFEEEVMTHRHLSR